MGNTTLHQLADYVMCIPPVLALRKSRARKRFQSADSPHMFYGVYPCFDTAADAVPANSHQGYDIPEAANLYDERTRQVYPADYPVMLWLTKAFTDGARHVLDLGGHIGVSYYAYRNFLDYPAELRWTVYDVPAVLARGRRFAEQHDSDACLGFCEHLHEVDPVDVLLASGSLQYTREHLVEHIDTLNVRPQWVVLSQLPVIETATFYTLQCLGFTYCPYRVQQHAELVEQMHDAGYRVVDHWDNLEKSLELVGYPDLSLDRYRGYCFQRAQ